ncbi:MAG TPA: adenylate/guanylate cyclase domain-containing protein [Candidatus Limnocylindria bacterium]|nr:adenylate/guanylate cyclase domain-containing protein [Candidatus Limnocylindria bacterium]
MAIPTPKILAVDDNIQNLELLTRALSAAKYEVITAGDGASALQLIDDGAVDLVLLDVMMPGMSGYEVCEKIRANDATRLLPVVMLTALHDVSHRIQGIAAGADDFLTKPFNREELLTRVKSLLRIKTLYDDIETKNVLLRRVIGRYVSEEVAAEIVADPGRHLKLGGEKRDVTVVFGDLRGFTPLAERLDPEDVVEILNVYLSHVVDLVFEFRGNLDKFRGDGFMAFFGAPLAHGDDAASAVRCGLALQGRLNSISFAKFPDTRLSVGIGINSGIVIAGNVGSERRADYTVIGNEVNLAQRFEANAGPGQILITGATYERVKESVEVRELGRLRVAGMQEGVMAYDVLRWRAA